MAIWLHNIYNGKEAESSLEVKSSLLVAVIELQITGIWCGWSLVDSAKKKKEITLLEYFKNSRTYLLTLQTDLSPS